MSLVSSYESPYVYEVDIPRTPTLAGFNFTVIDASTGLPIQNARCNIHAGLNGTGDTDGGYTDINGIFGIDAQWFVPRSWSVSKEGYIRQISNYMTSQIPVALVPTTIIYTVNILAGTGGSTVPTGFIDVAPNTELTVTAYPNAGYVFDYWVYKGVNAGSINPVAFLIDRDAITIAAVFKVVEEPPPNGPPPNGEPPTNGYVRPYAFFSNYHLKAQAWDRAWFGKTESASTGKPMPISAKLRYEVLYVDGTWDINRVRIQYNGDLVWESDVSKGTLLSGEIDVTGRTLATDNVRIGVLTYLGEWDDVQFSVWIDYTYATEPTEDPSPANGFREFIDKYGKWIGLGVAGLVILYMMKRPSIIVVGGSK